MNLTGNCLELSKARTFHFEVVYAFFGGINFAGVLFENFLWQKMFKECPVKFLARIVVRGNAVQIFSNFPAKFFGGKIREI